MKQTLILCLYLFLAAGCKTAELGTLQKPTIQDKKLQFQMLTMLIEKELGFLQKMDTEFLEKNGQTPDVNESIKTRDYSRNLDHRMQVLKRTDADLRKLIEDMRYVHYGHVLVD